MKRTRSRDPRPAGGRGQPRPARRRRTPPACRRPATDRLRRATHTRAPREPPGPATETPTTPTAEAGPALATPPRTTRSPTDSPESSPGGDVVTIGRVDPLHRVLRRPEQLPLPQRRVHLGRRRRAERPPSFTSIANSPRPRPSTRQRRSGILPSSDRGPGPVPPAVRLRRNIPSRRRPGPGPRVPHSRLSSSTPLHFQCCSPPRRRRHLVRIVQRGDQQLRVLVTFGQLDQLPQVYEQR